MLAIVTDEEPHRDRHSAGRQIAERLAARERDDRTVDRTTGRSRGEVKQKSQRAQSKVGT